MVRAKWGAALGILGMVVVFFARGHAQQPAGRELRIVPSSTAALRDWGNVVDGMLRTNELRMLSRRDDTLLQGRTIEQFAQFFKGVRVWGGSVSRQLSGPSVVSVFGTIYEGIDLDPTPGLNR